ncbi:MAG: hypothetical protein ACRDNZ_02940 [Streptosporangiaceae bacterium]
MRPYMPFMAALVLFGAVACGASTPAPAPSSSSSAHKLTPAQQDAITNAATCKKLAAYPPYTTKTEALAFVSFLETEANQAGVDNTVAGDMMTLSGVLTDHENGTKTETPAKVAKAMSTLTAACAKFSSGG